MTYGDLLAMPSGAHLSLTRDGSAVFQTSEDGFPGDLETPRMVMVTGETALGDPYAAATASFAAQRETPLAVFPRDYVEALETIEWHRNSPAGPSFDPGHVEEEVDGKDEK